MGKVRLQIDGKAVEAEEGMTVLEAARQAGIEIPTLCFHPELEPMGGCRLCMVELDFGDWTRLVVSCVYLAAEGLVVRTRSEKVDRIRKGILELQLAHGVRIREMPALFIGNHVLQGEEAIHGQLSDLIDGCLAGGGCPFPSDAEPSDRAQPPDLAPPPVLLQQVEAVEPGVVDYAGTRSTSDSSAENASRVQMLYFYRGTDWRREDWAASSPCEVCR